MIGNHGERLGNAEPPALSARKLLRVALQALGLNPHTDERYATRRCFSRLVARGKFSCGSPTMVPAERARIEREVRVLEHDLHAPTVLPHRARGHPRNVDAAKSNSAGHRFDQFQHQAAQRGLDTTPA